MSIYIWSDLHLGHKNIIKYENRPFATVEEMNEYLLRQWRETVNLCDVIINLGDVCLGYNKEELSSIIKDLPGHKILMMGNHDKRHSVTWWKDVGFDEVYNTPCLPFFTNVFISHCPLTKDKKPEGVLNIHGHVHSKTIDDPLYMNVSVEAIGYKPVNLEDLLKEE